MDINEHGEPTITPAVVWADTLPEQLFLVFILFYLSLQRDDGDRLENPDTTLVLNVGLSVMAIH